MIKLSPSILSALLGAAVRPAAVRAGYCNWGPLGTAESSVCDDDVQGGDWCNVDQYNCETGCGGRWCTNLFDGPPPPPSPTPPTPPPPTGAQTATTTRYWDCSGGACGCSFVPDGGSDDTPVHCHSNAMFEAPPGNEFGAKFYGAAAISASLGGGDWMAEGCGKCWKVTGTSNIPEWGDGVETTLVLKGTNFCPDGNPKCAAGPHFDIAAPGFDVLRYSFAHTCPDMEPEEAAGFAACGEWLIDDPDPEANCDCSLFVSETLRRGCENFYSLKWDNADVIYEEVTCPPELSDLHCGYPYALEASMPETCSSNDYVGAPPPTPPSTSSTTPATTTTTTTATTTTTTTTSDATTTTTEVTTTSEATTTTEATTTSTETTTTTQPPPTTTDATTTSTTTQPPPTTTSGQSFHCCSWDYSSCGDSEWCNESQENCYGPCGGKLWMEPNPNCIPLWGDCTGQGRNDNDCCNPTGTVTCNGNKWHAQCAE